MQSISEAAGGSSKFIIHSVFQENRIAASHLNKGGEGLVWKRKRFRKIIR